ncbi:MAG: dienelactone hydrolase family protein [Planctomycetaceae bacterium]
MSTPHSRRAFLSTTSAIASLLWCGHARRSALVADDAISNGANADDATIPQSVADLWADFDPRQDPIQAEVIREWRDDGCVFRHVRYLIGTFKGQPARMAAIYGFPEGAQRLPAVMHIHGGGQRGSLPEVKLLARRGYAALSVNWGGDGDGKPPFNSPDAAEPGDPNTDWGAVDPTQINASHYNSILPGPLQFFEDHEHPKNCNWYLLTLGCRRGLTFLEQQPEVDPTRLGVHGYSMGGNLTMYVAGTDDRVKAAVPAVGGAGWRWQPHQLLDGVVQLDHVQGSVETFAHTLGFESYAPLITCPVLHRSATNDFHGWMDDVYRTNALIEAQPTRYSWAPHFNHRLIPSVAVTMPLWLDQHLKGGPALPETPASAIEFDTPDRVPLLRVTPDSRTLSVARVEVYYSVDPDPRTRFWRSADVRESGGEYVAALPLHTLDLPLFAFANVYHALSEPVSMADLPGHARAVTEVCISSLLHSLTPAGLAAARVAITAKPGTLSDVFSRGLRDWYQLNAGNLTHQQTWTRKLNDPFFHGPEGAKLKLTLRMPETNRLTFVVQQNEWRSDRGPRRTAVCTRVIMGSTEPVTLTLAADDFLASDGPLANWSQIDQLGICAHFTAKGAADTEPQRWRGGESQLVRLEWELPQA